MFWIIILITFLIIGFIAYYFNKIIISENTIKNAWAQIDVQLKKRADLVPNLIETVKGYAKHEKNIFKDVTEARKEMLTAKTKNQKVKAGNHLADALKTIFAISENYPKLRASENFALLQEELAGIESKIAYARQHYNDSILRFNNTIKTVPGLWFARFMKKEEQPMLKIKEIEREPVKVKF